MKGLELSKQYYLTYGAPMIHEQFPQLESLLAVGLVGSGSECYGFDDTISQDHDFEPGFCLFIPDENIVSSQEAFALERAYNKLPKEFMGVQRLSQSPVGGNRHGIIRITDFYRDKIGFEHGFPCLYDWFLAPEFSIAEAVNGEVFRDDYGVFSQIRQSIMQIPEDVRRKKLASALLIMAQAGQYNYARCLEHGENGAAQLAIYEFTNQALRVIFLLNGKFAPFYKWTFRAMKFLPLLANHAKGLEFLISNENDTVTSKRKIEIIGSIAKDVVNVLLKQGLSDLSRMDLEAQAYAVNQTITDGNLRNEHILFAL